MRKEVFLPSREITSCCLSLSLFYEYLLPFWRPLIYFPSSVDIDVVLLLKGSRFRSFLEFLLVSPAATILSFFLSPRFNFRAVPRNFLFVSRELKAPGAIRGAKRISGVLFDKNAPLARSDEHSPLPSASLLHRSIRRLKAKKLQFAEFYLSVDD